MWLTVLPLLVSFLYGIVWRAQRHQPAHTVLVANRRIRYMLYTISISCFSIGRTYHVATSLMKFSEGITAYCITAITSRYVHVRTLNLTS
jgi:hypothetical protein